MTFTTFQRETDDYKATGFFARETWLKERAKTIGASEVATVMGIAPSSWGTPRDLWEKKRSPSVREEWNDDMRKGANAEAHIRELFRVEHPDLSVHDGTGVIFRSKRYPWLSCSLDGIIVQEDGTLIPLEIKEVRYTAHWKDGSYPRHYRYQCAAQMLVTGAKAALLLPRITYDFGDGRDWLTRAANATVRERPIVIRRSEVKGQFARMIRETKRFWDCVQSGEEPPIYIGR